VNERLENTPAPVAALPRFSAQGVQERDIAANLPTQEYRALSEQVLSLRSRCLLILGAVLAVSAVGIGTWLMLMQASNAMEAHMLALFLGFVVVAAMAITYKFYEKGFRIASYIEVFHEGEALGWHSRSRRIRDFVHNRRGSVPRRSLANILEPRIVAWVYLPLVVSAALLILGAPVTQVRAWGIAPAAFTLGLGTFLFLELGFFLEKRDQYWRWWWREYRRHEGTETVRRPHSPAMPDGPHDPATTFAALLLLQLAILFLIGLALHPATSSGPLTT
jgi:hypothetical protein